MGSSDGDGDASESVGFAGSRSEAIDARSSPAGGAVGDASTPAAEVGRLLPENETSPSRWDDDGGTDAGLHAARSARRRGDVDGALAHFTAAADRETAGVVARLALGEYLLALHLNDRAESVLKDVAVVDPRRAEAFEGLAEIARRRGDRHAAAAIVRAALRERPGNEGLTLRLVGDLVGLRRFGDAEKYIAMLASAAAPSSPVLRAAARIAVSSGDLAQAVERHRAAIAASPAEVRGYVELALLLLTHGRLDEAEGLLREAQERSPHDASCRAAAKLLARRKLGNDRLPDVIAAVGELPEDARSVRTRVEQLRSAGRHDEAEAIVEVWSVDRSPDYKLHFLAVVMARERGDLEMELAWSGAMAASFPDRAEGHKNSGFALAQMGHLHEARCALHTALTIEPRHYKCLSRLASLERDAGQLPAAIEILEGAVAEHGHDAALARKLVSFLLLAEFPSRAAHHLDSLLASIPDDASLREQAGQIAETLGHAASAIAHYRAAVRYSPDRPAAHLALARLLVADGRSGEAESVLRDAIRTAAFEPKLHLALADIVGQQEGRWEACLADLEEALGRAPLQIDLTLRRMHCFYRLNRLEAARHCGHELSEALPDDAAALVRIARIAEKARDFTTAFRHYGTAVKLDPRRAHALISVGRSMARLGQLGEAEAAIRAALEHPGNESTGLAALAEIERRRDNRERAAALVAEALAAEPDNAGLRLTLAEDLCRLDRFAEAEQRILPLMSDQATLPVLLCAARIAEARGRNDDALRYLSMAADAHPESSKAVLAFAAALYRLGRPKDAESTLRHAVEQHPDWAAASVQLARFLSDVGRFEESNRMIDDVIARHPGEIDAWILRSTNAGRSESTWRADEFLSAARERHEGNSRLAVVQCELAFARGLDDVGEDLLREAERRFPDDRRVQMFRLQRAIVVGQFSVVETILDQRRLPEAEVAYWRAQIESAHLRFPEAELEYRSALAGRPSYKAAVSGLIRSLVVQLKVEEARRSISILNQMNIGILTAKQQSLNPSQGFFGELSNDIWSNPDGVSRVRAALQEGRIGGLLDVVNGLPEYTGAAIALMVALRRSGGLAGPVEQRAARDEITWDVSSGKIPHKCFQFWDAEELPHDVQELTSSWRTLNKDWEYTLFNMKSARAFLENNVHADVRKAFRLAHHVAQKADIFRLAVLLREGGVYADADDRCMANLDLLVRGREIVLRHENLGSIGNNFIAVRPGHPVIEAALDGSVRAVLRGDSESIWLSTGPGMFTRAFAEYLAADRRRLSTLGREASVLLDWELRPFLASACRASYKSTVRHWSVREFAKAG